MPTRAPAPSPVSLSAPQAPRCTIRPLSLSASSMTWWEAEPSIRTIKPTPQASLKINEILFFFKLYNNRILAILTCWFLKKDVHNYIIILLCSCIKNSKRKMTTYVKKKNNTLIFINFTFLEQIVIQK